jgi:hypothetical protein
MQISRPTDDAGIESSVNTIHTSYLGPKYRFGYGACDKYVLQHYRSKDNCRGALIFVDYVKKYQDLTSF